MSQKRALVTGPTGFIGINLIKALLSSGHQVTAMVRATSDTSALEKLGVRLVEADLGDFNSLLPAVADQQVIYHLAAVARAIDVSEFTKVNLDGFENLMQAAIAEGQDPKLVFVSTLAAMGPSANTRPHREDDTAAPISNYGRSKRAAELLTRQYCERLNISIARPPIVLGPHDTKGLAIFQTIDRFSTHFNPSANNAVYSVIHVSDLCRALMAIAARGRRVSPDQLSSGIYFTAADALVTYKELGALVSQSLGKRFTLHLPVFSPILRLIGGINTLAGKLSGSPKFLNYDKVRDATAGSWSCENLKLKKETGVEFSIPFATRIAQTVNWYRNEGWLTDASSQHQSPTTAPIGNATSQLRRS